MSNSSDLFVSVIIPVFNDSKRLKKCLDALEKQTYPKSLYEIVVIDNGSTKGEAVKDVVGQFSQAFATYESHPGSYAARNKGISLAKGDVVAFTDADCIPAFDWLEKGVSNLLQVPNCGLVAGKVEFFFKDLNRPTVVEFYDSLYALPQKKFIEEDKFGVTANLFTFKSVLNEVGLFDHTLKSGGDRKWGEQVFSSGYQQIYADDACVAHPARDSYRQLYTKFIRVAGGMHDLKKEKDASFIALVIDLANILKPPLRTVIRIALNKGVWPWCDRTIDGVANKIELIFVVLLVQYIIAYERMRLYFGGTSKRGG